MKQATLQKLKRLKKKKILHIQINKLVPIIYYKICWSLEHLNTKIIPRSRPKKKKEKKEQKYESCDTRAQYGQ